MNAITACRHELLRTQMAMENLIDDSGHVEDTKRMVELAEYAAICKIGIEYLETIRREP